MTDRIAKLPSAEQSLKFEFSGKIVEPITSVLCRAFKYRHLICSNADFVSLNLRPDYLPLRFSINAGYAPQFRIALKSDHRHVVEAEEIRKLMEKPMKFDPDFKPFVRRVSTTEPSQKPLFAERSSVFVSHPLSLTGDQKRIGDLRIRNLKRAFNSILRSESHGLGRIEQLKNKDFCITAKDLPRHSRPNFRTKVEKLIKSAQYTVHDITLPAMGVFFEVGLAAAYCTPYFLFCDEDHALEDNCRLPPLISGLDIKRFSKQEVKETFTQWVGQRFHNLANSLPYSRLNCRFHSFEDNCRRTSVMGDITEPLLYLAISPGHNDVRKLIADIAGNDFNMIVSDDWHAISALDADCSMCAPIRACSCAIGLCDVGDHGNAVALGMLQGLEKKRIILHDRGDPRTWPLAMSQSQIFSYSGSTMESDISRGIRNLLKSTVD